MKRIVIAALVLAFSLVPVPTHGDEAVVLLELNKNFEYEPFDLEYKITIPPHKDNIWMCWGYINTDERAIAYMRESCEQLNGIYSPTVTHKMHKGLSAGEYMAYVVVYRAPYRDAGSKFIHFRVLAGLGR